MKLWCVSAPLVSHTDWGGFLPTARALARRGHQVTWVSEARIGGLFGDGAIAFAPVADTGWLYPLPPTPDFASVAPQEAVMLRYRRALDVWLSEDRVAAGVESLLALAAERGAPDAILTDPFLSGAALAADALDVPLIVCGWPAQRSLNEEFLYPVQRTLSSDSRERLDRLCARFGVGGRYFSAGAAPSILSPTLHLSYFSPDWYAAERETILPQTAFVGGLPETPTDAPPAWLSDIPESAPLALITLGTIFTGDLGFFSWAAQAAARAGCVPVVALGWTPIAPQDKAQLKAALPPTTRLLNWAPFAHVLARTRLVIHHGGMGTTHAAAVYGIPQICVPHAADQRGNARRVAQAKVGLNLTAHDVRHGALAQGALALRDDVRVQATAAALASALHALGGSERAATAIEQALHASY